MGVDEAWEKDDFAQVFNARVVPARLEVSPFSNVVDQSIADENGAVVDGWTRDWADQPGPQESGLQLIPVLPLALARGRLAFVARFVFAVAFANLLLDLFGDKIDGGVEIAFRILSKQVRPRHDQAHGAAKLPFGRLGVVMLQSDSSINREAVHVLEIRYPVLDMILDGLGQRHVMRRKNQLHT
jgi:hypothetical protein